jgi:hypothetical protein
MMVAGHEMPGIARSRSPSDGYGMIGWRGRSDRLERWTKRGITVPSAAAETVHVCTVSQAFHAWLPSLRPSETQVLDATSFQF